MSFFDDPEPRTQKPKPKDLSGMSIAELGDYVAALRAEITRAEEAVAAKRRAAEGAQSVFKS
ncbi:DUF1192 domain-containing protein [Arenibaculum sp.]|jgi:uncharacterized small protein (DUF1192 family)|uniref:DUF1192 domain-containing protein n=1 Tax=Arenibaculum sp. TaxID=2865862 RepID=UPI002E0D5193|nr:DUF1192 domain-containing protein [Arenibaculum sp.]